jgi:hypothetical protein
MVCLEHETVVDDRAEMTAAIELISRWGGPLA